MVKIGFKIARGGGVKPVLNEFKIANFTETLDLIPKEIPDKYPMPINGDKNFRIDLNDD